MKSIIHVYKNKAIKTGNVKKKTKQQTVNRMTQQYMER